MIAKPIDRWIVCYNGYTQGDRWRTGVGRIYRDIVTTCSGPDTHVSLNSWRDDVKRMADRILEWGSDKLEIIVIGYSYGGWTAVLLCRELAKRGIEVAHLVLIDAVWRFLPWIASPSSLFDNHEIVIPQKVKRVTSYRQKVSRPYGHKVTVDSTTTTLDPRSINVGHAYIDDQLEVRMTATEIACNCDGIAA